MLVERTFDVRLGNVAAADEVAGSGDDDAVVDGESSA